MVQVKLLGLDVVHHHVVEFSVLPGARFHHEACERALCGGQEGDFPFGGRLELKITSGHVPVADDLVVNAFHVVRDERVQAACDFAYGNGRVVGRVVAKFLDGHAEFLLGLAGGFFFPFVLVGLAVRETLVGDGDAFLDVVQNVLLRLLPALRVDVVVSAQVRFALLESVGFACGRREVRFLAVFGDLSREDPFLYQEICHVGIEQVVHVVGKQLVDVAHHA